MAHNKPQSSPYKEMLFILFHLSLLEFEERLMKDELSP